MISNLALIDNPKVRELGFKLMELTHVVDIRFFPTLRDDLKELAGANVVTYTAVTFKDNQFRRAFIIVPEEVYSDDTQHQTVIDQMQDKIDLMLTPNRPETFQNLVHAVIVPETTTPTEE
jgi:hypothetical protein